MMTIQKLDIIKKHLNETKHKLYDTQTKSPGSFHQSLEDLVYEKILDKLVYHELKPKERILDSKLAEEFGVSRSLVRQILNILEKEELVISIPRKGFYVKDITTQDVTEIYDIRKLLEVAAIDLAVPNLSDDYITIIESVFAQANEDLKKCVVESTIEADIFLHEMITGNCGNERLKKLINGYNNFFLFYRIIDLSDLERARAAYIEHYQILQAVKARDVEQSKKLMEDHIEKAKMIILGNFDLYTFGNNS